MDGSHGRRRGDDCAPAARRTPSTAPERQEAAALVFLEHDKIVRLLMLIVDLLGDVQSGAATVNYRNLRKATSDTIVKSIQERNMALDVLAAATEDES